MVISDWESNTFGNTTAQRMCNIVQANTVSLSNDIINPMLTHM